MKPQNSSPMPRTPSSRTQPQAGHLYDVAVVGAGLAGSELALRLAEAGCDVLLVTQALDHVGNLYAPTLAAADFPADSLLGQLAVELGQKERGGEVDTWNFHRQLKQRLEYTGGLHLLQSTVTGIETLGAAVQLSTWEGPPLTARRAALAVGAFLHARLSVGSVTEEAGRLSEVAYDFLADDLQRRGLAFARREQEAAAVGGAPPYTVAFDVVRREALSGFQLRNWPRVYAVGRVLDGRGSYAAALADAAELAQALRDETQAAEEEA